MTAGPMSHFARFTDLARPGVCCNGRHHAFPVRSAECGLSSRSARPGVPERVLDGWATSHAGS